MNSDEQEINKFDQLGEKWWDKQGEFKTLHDINPTRLGFIEQQGSLLGKAVIDIGCGGGLLSESLAIKGAVMTGIDLSTNAIACATRHAKQHHLDINYQQISAEDMAAQHIEEFDIIVCMELLEHVPDPASLIKACSKLAKPGGKLFFSTLNRNPKAYLLSIVAAEYVMKLLPKGTHDYAKFIKPAELTDYCHAANLTPQALKGLHYNPLKRAAKLTDDISVNYLLYATKDN